MLSFQTWFLRKSRRHLYLLKTLVEPLSDTVRGVEALAAIYSIVVSDKISGLNKRVYLEWVFTEMPNDARLAESGCIGPHLPWSDDVPECCRLPGGRPSKADALPDKANVDEATLSRSYWQAPRAIPMATERPAIFFRWDGWESSERFPDGSLECSERIPTGHRGSSGRFPNGKR